MTTPQADWISVKATLRIGRYEARIDHKPKKRNGHAETHPWHLSLWVLKRGKIYGTFAPVARCFRTEEHARTEARVWIARRGAR